MSAPAPGRVVIAGGSGLIGRALAAELAAAGQEVVILSRRGGESMPAAGRVVLWDGRSPGAWSASVDGAAAVVNLAGAGIADGRWTARRRARLLASRVEPTAVLVAAAAAASRPPAAFLQGSAVGWYGDRGDEELNEEAAAGSGFLAELARQWEAASAPLDALGVRRVVLRTGVVLAREGGAFARLVPPFRWGLGGPLGSGRQYFPWIHLADQVGAMRFVLARGELAGVVNLVAPQALRQRDFAGALGRALGRPALLPAPTPLLRLALGEMADVLLAGQRVVPARLLAAGYPFRFADLESALADLLPADGKR